MRVPPALSYRRLMLTAILGLVSATAILSTVVAYLYSRRAGDQMAERVVGTASSAARVRLEFAVQRAHSQMRANLAMVGTSRTSRRSDLQDVLYRLAPAFQSRAELSYTGFADNITGEYWMLERRARDSVRVRAYVRNAAGQPVIRDYAVGVDQLELVGEQGSDGYDPRSRPFFLEARKYPNADRWTEFFPFWKGNERGEFPGVSLVHAVNDSAGRLIGVWDVDLDLFSLGGVLRQLQGDLGGTAFVMEQREDRTLRVVAHPTPEVLLEPRSGVLFNDPREVRDPAIRALIPRLPGRFEDVDTVMASLNLTVSDQQWLARLERLPAPDAPRWIMGFGAPRAVLVGEVGRLPGATALSGMAMLLLAGLAAALLGIRLARPVTNLASEVAALSDGTAVSASAPRGPREIRQLTQAFRTMASSVAEQRERLQESNDSLQAEVVQRREAEAVATMAVDRAWLLFRFSPTALSITSARSFTHLEVNAAWEQLTGVPRDQALGRTVADLGLASSAEVIALVRDSITRKELFPATEFELARADGERRTVMLSGVRGRAHNGSPVVLWSLTDLTDRVRAQQDVQRANEQLAAINTALRLEVAQRREAEQIARAIADRGWEIFRFLPIAVSFTSANRFVHLEVNEAWERLMGVSRAEAIGKSAVELGAFGLASQRASVLDALNAGDHIPSMELDIQRPDGVRRIVLMTAKRTTALDGRPILLWCCLDITDRVAAEREVLLANSSLEERVAQRTEELRLANEELQAFSYTVSHDLRAPLRAIDGFANALEEDYGDAFDAGAADYLSRIRRASQRMGTLIDDLLSLAQVARMPLAPRTVDVSSMATELLDEYAEREPTRRVAISVAPDLQVTADPRSLRILLDNLLGNAWKYTRHTADARIAVTGGPAAGGKHSIVISDNGAGFDPAYKDNLFRPFQRLHAANEFEGTGIGLATVARIVTRHGGSVSADGRPGAGATIRVLV